MERFKFWHGLRGSRHSCIFAFYLATGQATKEKLYTVLEIKKAVARTAKKKITQLNYIETGGEMQMKLIKLTLDNFKGIRHFELDTKGGNASIYGDNATGKTTLFDAFLYLLFGKDSQNKADFALKTLDEGNNVIPGLDHAVEGIFEINGGFIRLRKYTRRYGPRSAGVQPKK